MTSPDNLIDAVAPLLRLGQLGVAVSGGSDSLALLHLLHAAGHRGLRAATVDHGLRAGSAAEAERVAEICAGLGIPHDRLDWTGWDGTGNLQDQARRARYRLLADWAGARGFGDVALGHTRDDQAETMLMGLARGAGLDGLSGMRPAFSRGAVRFHRPLLQAARADLQAWLTRRDIGWIDDPSNKDTRFDRVRARAVLAALAPLGIDAEALGRSLDNLRGTRDAIEAHLAGWAAEHVQEDRGDLLIDAAAFGALPEDFARRILNAALRWVSGADYPPRAAPVLALLGPDRPRTASTLHGCLVTSEPARLRVAREPEAAARAPHVATDALWDGRWRLTGPGGPGLRIGALGEAGLAECPGWRDAGLPRASLLASPAVWRGGTLISAPIAEFGAGWCAELAQSGADFPNALVTH